MSKLDRAAAELRARALRTPLVRASDPVKNFLELHGGVQIALSVNK